MRLFLHGFLGTKEDWYPLLHYFGKGVAINLPLTESDIPLAIHTSYPKADLLVGYSAGGRIALEMQSRFPNSYRKVVAISTHTGFKNFEERISRQQSDKKWISMLHNHTMMEFIDQWYSQPLFAPFRSSKIFEKVLKRRLLSNPLHWANFLKTHGAAARPSFEIHPSTRFIYGSEDLKYAALYRKVHSIEIAKAGHAVHLEKPAECSLALENIICENRSNDSPVCVANDKTIS